MTKPISLLLSCLSLGALGIVALPDPAQACSYVVVVLESSFPANGAVDVPLDARVVVYGPQIGTHRFQLLDGAGNGVPIEVTPAGDGGLSIGIFDGMQPNTTYRLSVRDEQEESEETLTFTTGDASIGSVPAPAAPDVELSLLDVSGELDSCGPRTGICVRGDAPAGSSLEVWVDGDVVPVPALNRGPVYRAYAAPVGEDECVSVRVRGPSGVLSEPTTFCGEARRRVDSPEDGTSCATAFAVSAPVDETADAVLTSGEAAEPSPRVDGGGCALRPLGAASGAGGLVLGLAALLVGRRRRAR